MQVRSVVHPLGLASLLLFMMPPGLHRKAIAPPARRAARQVHAPAAGSLRSLWSEGGAAREALDGTPGPPAGDSSRLTAWALLEKLVSDGTPAWENGWKGKCDVGLVNQFCGNAAATGQSGGQSLLQPPAQTTDQPNTDTQFRVSSVLYNEEAAEKVTPLSNAANWTIISADPTSPQAQDLLKFDQNATIVKEIWEAVNPCSPRTKCPIPVWDPSMPLQTSGDDVSLGNILNWNKVVIDTDTDAPCVEKPYTYATQGSTLPQSEWVPINCFHWIKALDSTDPTKSAYTPRHGQLVNHATWSATDGSFLVLVGFHIIKADTATWTWDTFWWSLPGLPESSTSVPNGWRSDHPADLGLPWSLYWMSTATGAEPREADTVPRIIFNPYLEGTQKNGPVSNCTTCHQLASVQLGAVNYVLPAMKAALQPRCALTTTTPSSCAATAVTPFDPSSFFSTPTLFGGVLPVGGMLPTPSHSLWSLAIHQDKDPRLLDVPDHVKPLLSTSLMNARRRAGPPALIQLRQPTR